MEAGLAFTVLLLGSVLGCQSVVDMVFSGGTSLRVDGLTPSGPSVQIFSSNMASQEPGATHFLVCILSSLNTNLLDVLWWVNDVSVTPAEADVVWMEMDLGGAYSTISVWEVSAQDWSSSATYWCGTIQEGNVYRQKSDASLCGGV